jgi:hypothetical protein
MSLLKADSSVLDIHERKYSMHTDTLLERKRAANS